MKFIVLIISVFMISCSMNLSPEGEDSTALNYGYIFDTAIDSSDNIYFLDKTNSKIYKGTMDAFSNSYGTIGTGQGAFSNPESIAIDSSDRIYIADTGNNRIIRINDITGAGWIAFTQGKCTSAISAPKGIFVSGTDLYIADSGNNRIVKVDIGASAIGESSCSTLGSLGSSTLQFNSPSDVYVNTKIYIADTKNHRIVSVDDMSGTNWTTYGEGGYGEGNFNLPASIVVKTHIYISDTYNSRIVSIDDMNGTNWTTWGNMGDGENNFYLPHGIWVNSAEDAMYISDSYNHRLVEISLPPGSSWKTAQ